MSIGQAYDLPRLSHGTSRASSALGGCYNGLGIALGVQGGEVNTYNGSEVSTSQPKHKYKYNWIGG